MGRHANLKARLPCGCRPSAHKWLDVCTRKGINDALRSFNDTRAKRRAALLANREKNQRRVDAASAYAAARARG